MHQPTALLSVFHKEGITEFAQGLVALGWKIISSGGTAKHLAAANVPVTDVAEISGLEPCLGHRVVTLVPQVHGGLLAADDQLEELTRLGWPKIDLVCVDLYPLKDAVENADATRGSVIEKTDIGGPTMLRSGAKGRRIVICDPKDRMAVLAWLKEGKPSEDELVTALCAKAEGVIADYCLASARFHSMGKIDGVVGTRTISCKYGENPFMQAGYFAAGDGRLAFHKATQLSGTEPSQINLTDYHRVTRTLVQISANFQASFAGQAPLIALAVKHGNCCGAAYGVDPCEVIRKMILSDTTSIHGATVLVNFPLDEALASDLRVYRHCVTKENPKRLIDVVIAPSFDEGAQHVMERKAGRCRMFENPVYEKVTEHDLPRKKIRMLDDGFIVQTGEPFILNVEDPRMEKLGELVMRERMDLAFAHGIGSTSNSNTIALVKDGQLIGLGVGQQSRVRGAKLALMIVEETEHDPQGAVAYSDSFFPFPDGLLLLARAGVAGVFASSGSNNDQMVLDALNTHAEYRDTAFWRLPDKICRGFAEH